MSEEVFAEVAHLIRSSVRVDVAAFVADNAEDRAKFGGSDAEYVRCCIEQDRHEYLESQRGDGDMGVTITEEWDEVEVSFL